MTNPAPGQPPAPHRPESGWPQQGAQQQPAPQPTALLPAAAPNSPNVPVEQAPDDATIRLPQVQPAPPHAQLPPPHPPAAQNAFLPPPLPQGPHQQWPPQGPGYPGAPGQPGPYAAAPPAPRKRNGIVIGAVAAVVALAVLVTGVVLTMQQAGESTPAAPDLASPLDGPAPSSESPGSGLPGSGDTDAALEELSASLRSNLNNRDVDGLLETVCEGGKDGDVARNALMERLPFLDSTSPQYSEPIDFPEGEISLRDDGDHQIDFNGNYTSSGEPISLAFRAVVSPDGASAAWCGVAA